MASIQRTVAAAIVGFAVGAGAMGGGFWAYNDLNPGAQAQANASANIRQYATVASAPATLPLGPDTVSNVVKRVSPAIVKIVATVKQNVNVNNSPFFNPFFGSLFGNQPITPQTAVQTDIGTGFFFNKDGYIVTNDHVINGASNIKVYVKGYSKPFTATVVGSDYQTDLAVLKINAPKPMPTLILGNSNNTPVGAWVIAIGNPYDLNDTVTVGVISAKGRPLTIGSRNYTNLLQTSAAINPGNSGGPLLNLAGQVVGINTAVSTQGQGIGFAIPTSTLDQIVPQLMKTGHVSRPWLGVFISTDNKSIAKQYSLGTASGVLVDYVEPNSPASRAGLTAGEVITQVNGHAVTTASALESQIKKESVGSRVSLTAVTLHGKTVTVSATLGQEPNQAITMPSTAQLP
ncbi:S1C family serine protease [Sulfobacillus harzensis]|uniref:Trypsin-like serine protease n=1 Tax=Sulfobacillus harzensis TaxID=2729629 RepID=A0A7Y0L1H6_9FIRM|nr:trypsin-like peptidase domain-containing protein [Sulfobacillus harzensis]NMP21026.1 trypsin-like serine protease [Sulfobacillus harzensis]